MGEEAAGQTFDAVATMLEVHSIHKPPAEAVFVELGLLVFLFGNHVSPLCVFDRGHCTQNENSVNRKMHSI
jgi:hypothetical protein